MKKTESIWHNGVLKPWDESTTHVLTHTLHYGGGAFEGIRFYATDQKPAIFRLPEHIQRLVYSSEVLGMKLNYTQAEIIQATIDLVKSNGLPAGYIRPISYYGYKELGVSAKGNPVELVIANWHWGKYLPHDMVDIKVSKYRRISPDATVIDAKICGHYIGGILASIELDGSHYHEALFMDYNDNIAEGAGENFFIVKDQIIYTPSLGHILPGITRATIIEITRHYGYTVVEQQITLTQALNADEAFFTGTAVEVTPIKSINDKIIGAGTIGPVTKFIKQTYDDVVHGRNNDFIHYLTFV
ncbi:Branched-chain amino acid aminotransferase [hydrothermal vent metagenome]|uniref:branched-chain-amino-acid transaminase n=1 Tax=hydrothermal vent metagenome TaxID=652676 RepID=A0A3B0VE80_9ZZZZ